MVRLAAAVGAAVAALAATARAQCDVSDRAETVFTKNSFTAEEVAFVGAPPARLNNGAVQLLGSGDTGTGAQFWLKQQERLADGFVIDFRARLAGAEVPGEGLAFIVHNAAIKNTFGSGGNSLGYRGNDILDNYLAVSILTCSNRDRNACSGAIEIVRRGPTDPAAGTTLTTLPFDTSLIVSTVNNPRDFVARFTYLANEASPAQSTVRFEIINDINGNNVQVQVPDVVVGNLADIFGSRFGFMGFSSVSPAVSRDDLGSTQVQVRSLTLGNLPSDTAVAGAAGREVVVGRSVVLNLIKRDSCQEEIIFPGDGQNNLEVNLTFMGEASSLEEANIPEDPVEGVHFILPDTVEFLNGKYVITFTIPNGKEGNWALDVVVDGVRTEGMPQANAVVSVPIDAPEGIPTFGLALIIAVIVLIVCGLTYAVVRLRRYRQKLRANQTDIEAGKEKHHLDMLERDVQFNMNPLMGSLEEMKQKVLENEQELARLRAGKTNLYDDDFTINQLQQQNAELRDEMNKLKKEAQQSEALHTQFGPGVQHATTTRRKEYEQKRV